VFRLRIVLRTDIAVATVADRGYWEEILGIMECLGCVLCYKLI